MIFPFLGDPLLCTCGVPRLRGFKGFVVSARFQFQQLACPQRPEEFDSHPGHHCFLLKVNEFRNHRPRCTRRVPHIPKARVRPDSRHAPSRPPIALSLTNRAESQ
jgi:hypothetical protein